MAVEVGNSADGRGERARFSYRRYWFSLYRRDVPAAEQLVRAAMRSWPAPRIYLRIFEPALNLSGTLWARGVITYADEHFITYHTLRFMRRVRRSSVPATAVETAEPREPCPPPPRVRPPRPGEPTGPLAVATTAGQNNHQIGLRMVCDFLCWDNWRIHWLASSDRSAMGEVVGRLKPDAVLISVGLDSALAPTARLIADLRRRGYPGLIVVGGRLINAEPSLAERLGADLTAPNGAALVRKLRPRFPTTGRRPSRARGEAGEAAAADEERSNEEGWDDEGRDNGPTEPPHAPTEQANGH